MKRLRDDRGGELPASGHDSHGFLYNWFSMKQFLAEYASIRTNDYLSLYNTAMEI